MTYILYLMLVVCVSSLHPTIVLYWVHDLNDRVMCDTGTVVRGTSTSTVSTSGNKVAHSTCTVLKLITVDD